MTAKLATFLIASLLCPLLMCEEPPTWAADRIIDIHAHIGTFRGYDLSKETLLLNLKQSGIRIALISNIDGAAIPLTKNLNETEANMETAKAVRESPDLLRGLIWARPEDGSPETVEPFFKQLLPSESRIFVGMKFHPEFNHFSADDPRVDGYLKLCERYHVPAVFHCGRKGTNSAPEKIYAAAKRFPSVPVVLYHMGFFGPHEAAIAVAKEALQRKDANLYLETAQAKPDAVMEAIRTLGAERVLFGTDASYYGVGHYGRYADLIELLKKNLSTEQFDLVMYKNAERLFDLNK